MFPSRITSPTPPIPQTEDIFSSALSTLFTDDVQNSHGVPGSHVTYHSRRFGDIELRIPQHPDVEEGRKLFAHYLWNAGVICADAVEEASRDDKRAEDREDGGTRVKWNKSYWDVCGQSVLELGAGTALPSIISALSGAASTTITDHPSSPALTTGAIEQNVKTNILERDKRKAPNDESTTTVGEVNIFGYTWGTTPMYSPSSYGKPLPQHQQPTSFTRIIIADCLWMPSQHVNLVKTVLHYLDDSDPGNCALVVAGFHTGRETVRNFLEIATGDYTLLAAKVEEQEDTKGNSESEDTETKHVAGRLRAAEIFEIDVNGLTRSWEAVREGDSREAAKRWCVVAVLVRR
ncbi:hypothetical protein H2200_003888 [Cladophialophora chaetospira]|uniref:Nicotinamide N-methyltransferase n=1 Tax=Cladophialophora chaetospira TaxID=386627 RepID=A0AA39CLG6_9EURO|nr:hypothetical protein H2200_003888 [Cladophialophora chaetospira]